MEAGGFASNRAGSYGLYPRSSYCRWQDQGAGRGAIGEMRLTSGSMSTPFPAEPGGRDSKEKVCLRP